MKRITITKNHLRLLKEMNVDWLGCEYGAPCIDPKRPYGNSDVEHDIIRHLGWEWDKENYDDPPIKLLRDAEAIHLEMKDVLQICLYFQRFEIGTFEQKRYTWTIIQ